MARVFGTHKLNYADGSKHAGSDLLVLLAIADSADDDGYAFPSVPTLGRKCRLSDRYVNKILAALRDSGELQIELNKGPRGSNLYRVTVGLQPLNPSSPPEQEDTLNRSSQGGEPGFRGGEPGFLQPLNPSSPEPSLNHQRTVKRPIKGERARSRTQPPDPQTLFPDVDQQVLNDWLQVRKAKRAGALTKTAADGLKREAEKLGIAAEQAIRLCAEKGWTGINANWDSVKAALGQTGEPTWRTEQRERTAAFAGPAAARRTGFATKDYSAGFGAGEVVDVT